MRHDRPYEVGELVRQDLRSGMKRATLNEACQPGGKLTDAHVERYKTVMHETSHLLVGQIVGLIPYKLKITASRSRKPAYVLCHAGHPSSPDIPIGNSRRFSPAKYRRMQEMQIIMMLIAGLAYDKRNLEAEELRITQSHPWSDYNASRQRLHLLFGKRRKVNIEAVSQEFEAVIDNLFRSSTYKSLVDAFVFRLFDSRRRCVNELEIRAFFHGFQTQVKRLRERYMVPFLQEKVSLF